MVLGHPVVNQLGVLVGNIWAFAPYCRCKGACDAFSEAAAHEASVHSARTVRETFFAAGGRVASRITKQSCRQSFRSSDLF